MEKRSLRAGYSLVSRTDATTQHQVNLSGTLLLFSLFIGQTRVAVLQPHQAPPQKFETEIFLFSLKIRILVLLWIKYLGKKSYESLRLLNSVIITQLTRRSMTYSCGTLYQVNRDKNGWWTTLFVCAIFE